MPCQGEADTVTCGGTASGIMWPKGCIQSTVKEYNADHQLSLQHDRIQNVFCDSAQCWPGRKQVHKLGNNNFQA